MTTSEPLSTRQLQILIALVDLGSFTKAAAHLGLSQSTVSGHIADLERRLGGRLLERDRSGVRPTPLGEAVLRPARDTLRGELAVRRTAADQSGLLSGRLGVGGSTTPAVHLLPELLARFRGRHSEVALRLVTGDSRDIVEGVTAGDVDVGVVGVQPTTKGLWSDPLARDELVLVCSPEHAFAGRARISARQVMREPVVLREPGSGTRTAMLQALRKADPKKQLDVVLEVGSTETVKAAVRAGLGVSFVSDLAVRDEVEAGHLCRVKVSDLHVPRSFWVVTRTDTHLSPAARAFRSEVLEGAPSH